MRVTFPLLNRQCILFDDKIENIEQVMRRGTANSFGLLVSVGRKSWQWIPEGWQNYQANIQSMWLHRFLEMTTAQQQLPLPFVSTVYGSPRRTMARSLPPQPVLPAESVEFVFQARANLRRAQRILACLASCICTGNRVWRVRQSLYRSPLRKPKKF